MTDTQINITMSYTFGQLHKSILQCHILLVNYTNQYYNVIYFWSTTQINITMSYTFGHCHCKQSLNTIAVHIYMKV
jgi:hypothetical protein